MADGAAGFGQGFSGPALLRIPLRFHRITGTGLSPSPARLSRRFPYAESCDVVVLQPRGRLDGPGLGSSAFARRYLRNHSCFLFLRVLRCFSSPRWPLIRCRAFCAAGFPIRTSPDRWIFAPPRGFSQLVASFLASESLGIPRTLLLDFLVSSFNCKSFFFSAARAAAKLTFDF